MFRTRCVGLQNGSALTGLVAIPHRSSLLWCSTPVISLTPMEEGNCRWKGTNVPKGSSQVERRTTKKVKTKKSTIMEQKDKKLAAIKDLRTETKPKKKKPSSLLQAAGIKQKKELAAKKAKRSVGSGEARQSRLTKPLKTKTPAKGEVEVVGGDDVWQEQPLDGGEMPPPVIERDYLVPGEPGYDQLPPPLDLDTVVAHLREEKGENIVALDVGQKCNFTKYMVIVEGRSGRHLRALGDMLVRQLKNRQRDSELHTEIINMIDNNRDNNDWLTVDTGNVLVHLFSAGARRYYDLDELWASRGSMMEEMARKDLSVEELDPLPDLNDVPGGWNPFDMK